MFRALTKYFFRDREHRSHFSAIARKRNKSLPHAHEAFMASLLTRQWLNACVVVPTDDFSIITQLVQRAVREGHAVTTLAALQ
jgi:hypothetical protein